MKTTTVSCWLGVPLWACMLAQLPAAELKFTLTASADNFELGSAFEAAGDINGDGQVDLAVADRSARVAGFFASGVVHIISGVDGSVLRSYSGKPAASQSFGAAIVALNADGDSIPDLAVGSPGESAGGAYGAGALRIYAGATAALLSYVVGPAGSQMGGAITNAGDQNADGIDDLYVGAPGANGSSGCVYVIAGATGQTLRSITTDASTSSFGVTLATLGDVDGDGRKDVAIGAPAFRSSTAYQAGRVVIARSSNDTPRPSVIGAGFYNRLGESLATVTDVNGDGQPDLMIGSYSGGTARVVSGIDLTTLKDLSIPTLPLYRQLTVAGSLDLDNDGIQDWLIGSPGLAVSNNQVVGGIRVVSGADSSALLEYKANAPYTGLGVSMKVLPGFGFAAGETNLRDAVTMGSGRAYFWETSADADGDGVLDADDAIPHSIMDPTVQFAGVDSGVPNRVDPQGITLADRFAMIGAIDTYQPQALYFIEAQRLAKELVASDLLTTAEQKDIATAARRAALPVK